MSKRKGKKARQAANNMNAANTNASGMLGPIGIWLREHPSEQFLIGALAGAALAYVLSNEELRGKILKNGLGMYGAFMSNLAELREQVADIQAEIETGAPV
jgi:hypothetical protein